MTTAMLLAAAETVVTHAHDDGVDGTDLVVFLALFIGGLAIMAAVAALVMGRKRIPQ